MNIKIKLQTFLVIIKKNFSLELKKTFMLNIN